MRRSESKVIEFAERKLIPPRHILVVDDSERTSPSYAPVSPLRTANTLAGTAHGHIKPTTFTE